MSLESVFAYIDEQAGRFVEELREYLRLPSISAQKVGLEEGAAATRALMARSGIEAVISPTNGGPAVVYGELPARNPRTLLCYAHYDVQPPDPLERWTFPPFAAEMRDGVIYARGATDDKSGLLAFVYAAEAFLRTRGESPVFLKFLFEGEEEVGSPHLEDWVIAHADQIRADGMHCLDGGVESGSERPRVALGNKAILYVELRARGPRRDVHSNSAGLVTNPAWRLIWALGTIKNAREEITIDGWYDDWDPPTEEDIAHLEDAIAGVDAQAVKASLGVDQFLLGRSHLEAVIERYHGASANVCGFGAGYLGKGGKTIVPSEAFVKLDFRLPPRMDPYRQMDKLRAHLRRHGFDDIEVIVHTARKNPWKFSSQELIAQAVIRAATQVFGKPPAVHGVTAEGTIILHTHIPCVLTGFGPPNCNLHAPDENITVNYFIKGIKYAAAIMEEFALAERAGARVS